jgi:hypothetical protein
MYGQLFEMAMLESKEQYFKWTRRECFSLTRDFFLTI